MALSHNLVFLFQVESGFHAKVKTSNVSGTVLLICFIRSANVWDNILLLNKNYWHDLDIVDEGNNMGNISQFCLYLGYPWTNFNKISTTMMALWPATKKNIIILSWKCWSSTAFTKIDVSQLLYDRFLPTFTEMMAMWSATKMSYQLILKIYVKVGIYKNYISAICRSSSHFTEQYQLPFITPMWSDFSSRMMIPLSDLPRLCAGLHFFTLDITASSTWMHPTNQPFICGLPLYFYLLRKTLRFW